MGLLFTTMRVEQGPNYPQTVNHRHETSWEAVAKLDEMRERLRADIVKEMSPDNTLLDMQVYRDARAEAVRVCCKINGKVYDICCAGEVDMGLIAIHMVSSYIRDRLIDEFRLAEGLNK